MRSSSDMLRAELTPIVVRVHLVFISVLSGHGLISPDLTRAEHGVHGTSEAAGGSDSSDLPSEALFREFIRLR